MKNPYWPLFDLEVRTPGLTLRYVDDELAVALVDRTLQGVHDPAFMPFAMPWTDTPPPELERESLRFYWRSRASTTATSWNLVFAVLVDGVVVGCSTLGAEGFPVKRWVETGSWIGRDLQGGGLGTETRVATLHLAFAGLDAAMAGTGAFTDNPASLAVTRKLGYEPNGIAHHERRGELGVTEKYRMSRQHFDAHVRRDDIEIVGAESARAFLGIER